MSATVGGGAIALVVGDEDGVGSDAQAIDLAIYPVLRPLTRSRPSAEPRPGCVVRTAAGDRDGEHGHRPGDQVLAFGRGETGARGVAVDEAGGEGGPPVAFMAGQQLKQAVDEQAAGEAARIAHRRYFSGMVLAGVGSGGTGQARRPGAAGGCRAPAAAGVWRSRPAGRCSSAPAMAAMPAWWRDGDAVQLIAPGGIAEWRPAIGLDRAQGAGEGRL